MKGGGGEEEEEEEKMRDSHEGEKGWLTGSV
jgi:hypothetical protein